MSLSAAELKDLRDFHENALVFDIHFHPRSALPAFFRYIGHHFLRNTMPPLEDLSALGAAGVDGCALAAIGDRQIGGPLTIKRISKSIAKQLARIHAEVTASGGRIAKTADDIMTAKRDGALSFVLSLEGGDMLHHPDDVVKIHRLGFRLLTLVHLNHNSIGRVGATTWNYWRRGCQDGDRAGLSAFGEVCVKKMNELGVIIDVSHTHHCTLMDVASLSSRPVVASHAGAQSVSEFHRYLSDDEIQAIARTGGVIGLWPMYYWGRGMSGFEDFKAHLDHIINLVGEDHLAIGTDAQGVPGLMPGFDGVKDYLTLTGLLFEAGLSETQARKVLGLNFLRVLDDHSGKSG